nr:myomegalin-like [Symphalangus syndactylus]
MANAGSSRGKKFCFLELVVSSPTNSKKLPLHCGSALPAPKGESLVKQDSKQVQVDLQDLGYETCGQSKNEAEREETTSPECEEHNSLKEMVLMEGLCSEQGRRGSMLASSSERKPLENQLGKQEEFHVYGKAENISVLRRDIKDLKAQLQNANKIIENLKSRVPLSYK